MRVILAFLTLLAVGAAWGQPHQMGAIPPKDLANRIAVSARMPVTRAALPDAYDARERYRVPVLDQGQCGSCWDFAGTAGVSAALYVSGQLKPGQVLSTQYTLDQCETRNGGCNGDWPETVAKNAKGKGIPLDSDYPAYEARARPCRAVGGKTMHRIRNYGYVGTAEGVAPTEGIQQAIYQYGSCIVAVAVTGAWDNYRGGVYEGSGGRGINHAVLLVGWDRDAKGLYWIMQNSWGTRWGEGGFMRMRPGADAVGWGAMWVDAGDPPAPPPPPPGPTAYAVAGEVWVVSTKTQSDKPVQASLRGTAVPAAGGGWSVADVEVSPDPGLGTFVLSGTATVTGASVRGTVTLTPTRLDEWTPAKGTVTLTATGPQPTGGPVSAVLILVLKGLNIYLDARYPEQKALWDEVIPLLIELAGMLPMSPDPAPLKLLDRRDRILERLMVPPAPARQGRAGAQADAHCCADDDPPARELLPPPRPARTGGCSEACACGCQAGEPCGCRTLIAAAHQPAQAAPRQSWPPVAPPQQSALSWPVPTQPARLAPAWCPT